MDTDAQEITRYFVSLANIDTTYRHYARMVAVSKEILMMRHSKVDIIRVIDYLIKRKRMNLVSLVYVKKCMDDVLFVLEQEDRQEEMRLAVEQMSASVEKVREVIKQDDSSERNRQRFKAGGFGVKPRLREEHYLNLLKGSE